jgi:predicted dithiol-disulfide oxidoreductase (DUF899 family)
VEAALAKTENLGGSPAPAKEGTMNLPPVVSPAEWQVARENLLVKEKEATRARDALAAERRQLPMIEIDKDYLFEGPNGKASLLDLFDGRRQLIIYHFMFAPGVGGWPAAGCEGCSMFVDNVSVFLRHGDRIYRTYFTSGRGVEALGSNWTFLDLTPLGRQEDWEKSPAGWPQTPRYEWWRRHDEYEAAVS